jgi:hypothetical protein
MAFEVFDDMMKKFGGSFSSAGAERMTNQGLGGNLNPAGVVEPAKLGVGARLNTAVPSLGTGVGAAGRGVVRALPVAGPVLAVGAEGMNVARVANDPNATKMDVAGEVAAGTGRLAAAGAGAKLGGIVGSAVGPVGSAVGAVGGAALGYMGADTLIDAGRSFFDPALPKGFLDPTPLKPKPAGAGAVAAPVTPEKNPLLEAATGAVTRGLSPTPQAPTIQTEADAGERNADVLAKNVDNIFGFRRSLAAQQANTEAAKLGLGVIGASQKDPNAEINNLIAQSGRAAASQGTDPLSLLVALKGGDPLGKGVTKIATNTGNEDVLNTLTNTIVQRDKDGNYTARKITPTPGPSVVAQAKAGQITKERFEATYGPGSFKTYTGK